MHREQHHHHHHHMDYYAAAHMADEDAMAALRRTVNANIPPVVLLTDTPGAIVVPDIAVPAAAVVPLRRPLARESLERVESYSRHSVRCTAIVPPRDPRRIPPYRSSASGWTNRDGPCQRFNCRVRSSLIPFNYSWTVGWTVEDATRLVS